MYIAIYNFYKIQYVDLLKLVTEGCNFYIISIPKLSFSCAPYE